MFKVEGGLFAWPRAGRSGWKRIGMGGGMVEGVRGCDREWRSMTKKKLKRRL